MYSFFKFILLLMLSVTLYSCEFSSDSEATLPKKFEYPLKIGNNWEYERVFEHFNFRPDSIKNNFPYAKYVSQSIVEVINDTTLQDSINCFVISGRSVEDFGEFWSWSYYSNKPDGLYKYGYSNGGIALIMPKGRSNVTFSIGGISFQSIKEASDYFSKFLPSFAPFNDTLIYYDTPRKILTYPPEIGSEWTLHRGSPFTIYKTIVGTESVSTNAGIFNCYKVQWTYDSSFEDNILFYDYVCEKGLIKRSILFNDVLVSTTSSPGGEGYVDSRDETILTDINF